MIYLFTTGSDLKEFHRSVVTYRETDLRIRFALPCTCNSIAFTHLGETRACSIDDTMAVRLVGTFGRSVLVMRNTCFVISIPEAVERLIISQSTFTFEPMVALRCGVLYLLPLRSKGILLHA